MTLPGLGGHVMPVVHLPIHFCLQCIKHITYDEDDTTKVYVPGIHTNCLILLQW